MEKIYGKVTQQKQTGYSVMITSTRRHSNVELPYETMHIDMSGNVMYIDHGGHIYNGEDPNFRRHVRFFMESLLEDNVGEFKNMRNVLSGVWHEMAESIRKAAISKFDF